MAAVRLSGQDIFVHGAQEELKEEQQRKCWYLWSTKDCREKVLNQMEFEMDERGSRNNARLCPCKFWQTHAARSKTKKESPR